MSYVFREKVYVFGHGQTKQGLKDVTLELSSAVTGPS